MVGRPGDCGIARVSGEPAVTYRMLDRRQARRPRSEEAPIIPRRIVLGLVLAIVLATSTGAAEDGPFRFRGYYLLATRYPTAGLDVWKDIVDRMDTDGCNLLIYWVAGGFRSKKFPE